jgi:hypothetical protein
MVISSVSTLDNFAPTGERNLQSLPDETQRDMFANTIFASTGLAIHGSTRPNILTANAVTASIGGKLVTIAANSSQSIAAVAAYVVPVSSTAYIGIWTNAAGALSFSPPVAGQGILDRTVTYSTATDKRNEVAFIGYIKIITDGATTFTPGTTNLNASGITATYVNCNRVPAFADL